MNATKTTKAGERTQNEDQAFPIDIMAQSYGHWALGFSRVTVTIPGKKVKGLALYARYRMNEPKKQIVATFKDATDWLLDVAKVPNRAAGKFMANVEAELVKEAIKNTFEEEPKHTPGPWIARNTGTSIAVFGRNGTQHVMCERMYYEAIANANLISAAPEMFERLKECVKVIRQLDRSGSEHPAVELANEVLAKAEGRAL